MCGNSNNWNWRTSETIFWFFLPALVAGLARADDPKFEVKTTTYQARFQSGSLVSLRDAQGQVFVQPNAAPQGLAIHRTKNVHRVGRSSGDTSPNAEGFATRHYGQFSDLPNATAETKYQVDAASQDVALSQQCVSEDASVWGVSWSIEDIPLEASIIVPGRSGVRLTCDAPGREIQFDYPISWEAQLVIVEFAGRGFYVWAEDTEGRFKRLVVRRHRDGWRLEFVTINTAPFDNLKACQSVRWRLNVYEGDWRVPARRYREWAEKQFQPTPIAAQRPGWIKDTRAMVIVGLSLDMLEALPRRLDPKQTVLYVPSWRAAGYDRDYPVYDQTLPQLRPFVDRAHALGFRVMLHVNYFGVDPLNAAYAQFEPFQVRDPWGKHEKKWWLWTRAEPEIRFAYINPAVKAWRNRFTQSMVTLCRDYQIDALHLDQTLCIYNDHNGPIDGMTMVAGNVALHRQLREALPEVALSGEGLNEITYRHEAFAQRHAWGVNHADATWDRRALSLAHPISSYLFRPYTIINGYLGCAPPTEAQLYAAWNEAYEHWGVIPTLKPSLDQLQRPTGFSRQFYDEVRFWQQQRLEIDMEAAWPDEVAFPFHTEKGDRVTRTLDGKFMSGQNLVSRTVSGMNRAAGSLVVPGWRAFNRDGILGLDPMHWYPCFEEPRQDDLFHVSAMPDDMIAESVVMADDLAMVRLSSPANVVADLVEDLDRAVCGSRPLHGEAFSTTGPFAAPDGAGFDRANDVTLSAHPPYKAAGSSTGVAYARYRIRLPETGVLRFRSEVFIDRGAVGQANSDGVTFGVTAHFGGRTLRREVHHAAAQPEWIELDLSPFAGIEGELELTVHPGPDLKPSFDWARWRRPRVEREVQTFGSITVSGEGRWEWALGAQGRLPLVDVAEGQRVSAQLPGTVFFLRAPPKRSSLPLDLVQQPWRQMLIVKGTHEAIGPSFVTIHVANDHVGGVLRRSLATHPPNNGLILAQLPLDLPDEPSQMKTWVGLRDGSKSEGVLFRIQVNGQAMAERRMLPGGWEPLEVDLSPWRGKPVVLSLIVDSDGGFGFDWAVWGDPRIERIQ